jgi:hypothetical protein
MMYHDVMQGVLTFVTMTFAAAFQIAFVSNSFHSTGPCGTAEFANLRERGPSLEQRLAAMGVPEVHEAFGLEVAETPDVLRHSWSSPPPYSRGPGAP